MMIGLAWFLAGVVAGFLAGYSLKRWRHPDRRAAHQERSSSPGSEMSRLVGVLVVLLALFSIFQANTQQRATEQLQSCLAADRQAMATLIRDIISGQDARAALERWLERKRHIANRCATE